jgi:hypothetical protein
MRASFVLPEINETKSSLLDICKGTKKFIKNKNNYHSFLRTSYLDNREKVKSMSNIFTSSSKTNSVFASARSTIDMNNQPNSPDVSEFFCTTTENNNPFISPFKRNNRMKKIMVKQKIIETDFFTPNFYDYLKADDSKDFKPIYEKNVNNEETCLKLLTEIKDKNCKFLPKLKGVYNPDHESNRVHINIKSFKIEIRDQNGLDDSEYLKLYLPLDICVIFAFLAIDEILFFISQVIFLDEEKKIIKLNQDRLKNFITRAKYFGGINREVTTRDKFKFDRNIKFKLFSENSIYNMVLHCPEISFHFIRKKFTIKKHITLDFLLVNLLDNFNNWEALVLDTFKQDKEFRHHFNKLTSKTNPYKYSVNKVYLNIDKRFKPNLETYCLEATSLPFIYKSNGKIRYINLQGYSLEPRYAAKQLKIMNWRISLIFLQLRNILNIETWINKRTRIDKNGEIAYDKNWINDLDSKVIQFYCRPSDDSSNSEKKQMFKVNPPKITVQVFNEGKYNKQNIFLNNDQLNVLSQTRDMISILEYFYKNIGSIIALKEESMESSTVSSKI